MFRSRLKAKNLMYINQLLQVLSCFLKVLQGLSPIVVIISALSLSAAGNGHANSKLVRLNEFLFLSNLDNINMFKVNL